MRRSRWSRTAPALLAAAAFGLVAIPATFATFASEAESAGNQIAAAADFRPPQVTAAVLGKTLGSATGFVKPGSTYYVYANVATDTGNPASGIDTVTADVASFSAGSTTAALAPGSYTAAGTSYGYRSPALTAGAAVPEGPTAFTVTATDNVLNAATLGGSAVIDSTAPQGADAQTANAGSNGLAEQGDAIVLTFSEPVEPHSILAGWSGAATNVAARIADNGLLALPTGNDTVQIYDSANKALLPLGSVDLGRGDYVSGLLGGHIRFGASGTPSTMSLSGSAVTIVLGTYGTPGLFEAFRTTAAGAGTMSWSPTATPYDRAGNTASTAATAETGAVDRDF